MLTGVSEHFTLSFGVDANLGQIFRFYFSLGLCLGEVILALCIRLGKLILALCIRLGELILALCIRLGEVVLVVVGVNLSIGVCIRVRIGLGELGLSIRVRISLGELGVSI